MHKPKRNVVAELKKLGLSDDLVFAAYSAFGRKAVGEIIRNPYSLVAKYEEDIDWKALDRFAAKQGFENTGIERLAGGVLYAMRRAAASGHVYYPRIPLLTDSARILGIEDLILIQNGLESLRENGLVIQEQPLDLQEGRGDWIYLMNLHSAESGIAHYMALLAHSLSRTHRRKTQEINFEEIEQSLGIHLAEAQREAIRLSMDDKILVITGGPGTGKTTILKATVTLWAKIGKRIKLAAPTGRAAKRLSESTGREASTIHRLLEYNPEQRTFNRNGYRPLKVDLMVVDEASMIDTTLMAALLEALPPGAHLLLVGDVDQLPSVGPGFVLRDIIRSGLVSVIALSEIFRQRPGSLISDNAARINRGESPVLDSGGVEEGQDFFFIRKPDLESTLETVVEMVTRRIPEQFGFTPMDDIQVLAPMIKGHVGIENLNIVLQRELNPDKNGVEQFGYRICPGDK
ncbi:MAG TPA: AAA family ATPase, partial [bacterium]|nr:AAA family ATPase [bacterium]